MSHNQPAFGPPTGGPPVSPYDDFNLSALEAVGNQNASSTPSGGAASQDALGNPASVGGTPEPAFADVKGEGEAKKPASDYHRMFLDAEDADKAAVADQVERGAAPGGKSLDGMMNDVFEKGGLPAMELAKAYGWIPPEEKAGQDGFKTREKALSDYGVAVDKQKETEVAEQDRLTQRYAMGGFLMDVGLRILASNRDDAGGAIGEGILGAQQARTDKKDKAEAKTVATEDRERKHRREDEADKLRREKGAREAEEAEYDKTQRGAKARSARTKDMEQIITDDGRIFYIDPLDSDGDNLVDKDGNVLIAADVGLSKEAIAAQVRQNERNINAKVEKMKVMSDWDLEKTYGLKFEGLTGDERLAAITKQAAKEVRDQATAAAGDETIDYKNY